MGIFYGLNGKVLVANKNVTQSEKWKCTFSIFVCFLTQIIDCVIIHSIYPVLKFAIKCKLVIRFPIWYFVHSEPVHCGFQVSWLKPLYILNICKISIHAVKAGNWCVSGKVGVKFLQKLTVEFCSFWILNVNGYYFPVCFSFIDQCQDSQHFHSDDFSVWADLPKNNTEI